MLTGDYILMLLRAHCYYERRATMNMCQGSSNLCQLLCEEDGKRKMRCVSCAAAMGINWDKQP
eukprot:scaffold9895_cov110-Skeletonema_marinoi.AAC.1